MADGRLRPRRGVPDAGLRHDGPGPRHEPLDVRSVRISRLSRCAAGRCLTADDLDRLGGFARYKDVDGDGVGYRTLPGTNHPAPATSPAAAGTPRARSTANAPTTTSNNVDRLARKFETIRSHVPRPEVELERECLRSDRLLRHFAPCGGGKPRSIARAIRLGDELSAVESLPVHRTTSRILSSTTRASTWSSRTATAQMLALLRWNWNPAKIGKLRAFAITAACRSMPAP